MLPVQIVEKPVFCSNCFGDKKNAGGNGGGGRVNLDELNAKLDKILSLLSPNEAPAQKEVIIEEVITETEEVPALEVIEEKPAKKARVSKKKV